MVTSSPLSSPTAPSPVTVPGESFRGLCTATVLSLLSLQARDSLHSQYADTGSLIPDGAIQSAHFIKTPLYVQIHGMWDGTKVNIPEGDSGGELDPHGAKNEGNPIGGNVTSNVGGTDVFYEEWMSFVSLHGKRR